MARLNSLGVRAPPFPIASLLSDWQLNPFSEKHKLMPQTGKIWWGVLVRLRITFHKRKERMKVIKSEKS